MSAIFSLDQVLALTESITSEYSTTSKCLSARLGRPGRVKFILNSLRWKKKTNAPITHIRLLPGDSAPLGVVNTAATGGGNGSHSRGGGGLVRKDTSPVEKKNPEGENRLDHGPKSPPWRTTVLNLEFEPRPFVILVGAPSSHHEKFFFFSF